MLARDWGRGARSYCFVGTEFQFYKMKRVMEMDGNACITL